MSVNDNFDNDNDDENIEDDFHIPYNTNYRNNPKPKEVAYKGKEITNWYDLTREDRGIVKNIFREGIIKGFKLHQMHEYIFVTTKIILDKKLVYKIKTRIEHDNHYWYYHMARDNFAYVTAYRKCIDEVELYKEQLWHLIIKNTTSDVAKVAAVKELHNLSKTSVLLLKDLPFVMNLSKFYDPDILDPNRQSLARLGKNPRSPNERGISFLDTETDGYEKHHTSLVFNTLERIESKHTMSDELTERLREQSDDEEDDDKIE